jgi:hypothetical protein
LTTGEVSVFPMLGAGRGVTDEGGSGRCARAWMRGHGGEKGRRATLHPFYKRGGHAVRGGGGEEPGGSRRGVTRGRRGSPPDRYARGRRGAVRTGEHREPLTRGSQLAAGGRGRGEARGPARCGSG